MNILKITKALFKNTFFFFDLFLWFKIYKNFPKQIGINEKWITPKKNLYVLRKLIKIYKPKKIIEFGSGIGLSSQNIVDQMSQNCEFIGIENNEDCINQSQNRTKKFNKNINFIRSDLEISKDKINAETLIYNYSKSGNFKDIDLVYIDGPSFYLNEKKQFFTQMVRGDIFNIYNQLKPGCIIVLDGSFITQKNIIRFCKSIEFLGIYKTFAFKITKTDELEDLTYKKLKLWGYL